MNEPCAQCRIEIAAGERTEPDPDCFACGGVRWINSRTGERVISNTSDDRPLAPWLTNETRSMTEAEMREAVDALPDLLKRPKP